MVTYNAGIVCFETTGNVYNDVEYNFNTVEEATEWLTNRLSLYIMNWAKIDPNGISIVAEVYNEEIGFSDLYELKCGL